jgi:hypothetical protein
MTRALAPKLVAPRCFGAVRITVPAASAAMAHDFRADAKWWFAPDRVDCQEMSVRRFLGEAFTQEPIDHQLGVNLKPGWCGFNDCAETFGRYRHGADVAIGRGDIRHDLSPSKLEDPDQSLRWARGSRNWIKGHCTLVHDPIVDGTLAAPVFRIRSGAGGIAA